MGKGDIPHYYKTMSAEDQRTFNRWIKRNAIVGSILAIGLMAMALVGSNSAPPPAVANSANPKALPSELYSLEKVIDGWLTATFDLPANGETARIEFVAADKMAERRYRGVAGNEAREFDAGHDTVAVYNDAERKIYLPKGWLGVTPAEHSILVHEMVHHLQNLGSLKYECPEAREKLAFAAQERWLQLFDRNLKSEFDLDPFTLLVRTTCLG